MLNAKNKKMLQLVGALFAGAVLVFAFLRAKKASEAAKVPVTKVFVEEVKSLLTAA